MSPVTVQGGFARPAAPDGPRGTEPAAPAAPRGARGDIGLPGQPGSPQHLLPSVLGHPGCVPAPGWGSWDAPVPG